MGSAPLTQLNWVHLPLDQTPKLLGEWRLPISANRPEMITEARVQLQLLKAEKGGWKLRLAFSFPDPKPFGIPFTFQKARLTFTAAGEIYRAEYDWSQDCSGPGRSMFPGQSWSTLVDLPKNFDFSALENPVFQLWGARI